MDRDRFEFTKMAVDQRYRRRGIARQLLLAGFEKAWALAAVEVILYSNQKNEDAVRLYERLGFIHQEVEPGVYIRANVKMSISAQQMQEMIRHCSSLIPLN